ncbi:MAG: hypothetical protein WBP93_04535 [Pyrinomonadaceae bacterium]
MNTIDELKKRAAEAQAEAQAKVRAAIEGIARGGTVEKACDAIRAAGHAQFEYDVAKMRVEADALIERACEEVKRSVARVEAQAAQIVARGRASNPHAN